MHTLNKLIPLTQRLRNYSQQTFVSDLIGGVIVAVMLVPQAMAYAMLAGLPPQVGLYASIAPVILYALWGSSYCLAVGPVAMIALLVSSGVGNLATPGSPEYLELCLLLAGMVGVMQIGMAIFRLGFLVNFISHPVLKGFTCAAALVIGMSQVQHLLGVSVERADAPYKSFLAIFAKVPETNMTTLVFAGSALIAFWLVARYSFALLKRLKATDFWAETLPRFAPLIVVVISATLVAVYQFQTKQSLAVIGNIPRGLPSITIPEITLENLRALIPLALLITLIGFLESYSVAKALGSSRREKVDPNRELLALGAADIGAAFTGGFPVTGGFSRSVVSQEAGVRTPIASIITALLVGVSVVYLAPLFFYIPKAILAAIIVAAVVSLLDFKQPFLLWKYSKTDSFGWMITFTTVIFFGIEFGIFAGVISTACLLMRRISRPFVTELGRVAGSEHFRNVDRFEVDTYEGVTAFRIDASLIFANAPFVEEYVLGLLATTPSTQKLLLVASGINDIDATGIELLHTLRREARSAGSELYLSDVKGPVSDKLIASGVDREFIDNHIFLSADQALSRLSSV